MNYCISTVVSFTRLLYEDDIWNDYAESSFKKYIYTGKQVKHLPFCLQLKKLIYEDINRICDPLCENPAEVIFLWFAVFCKKKTSLYGKEHSVKT